ncbi:HD domain-containing phosphohydrolase [Calidifontibacter terrae]
MSATRDRRWATTAGIWALVSIAVAGSLVAVLHSGSITEALDWRLGLLILSIAGAVPLRMLTPAGRELAPVAQSIMLATAATPVATSHSVTFGTALIVLAVVGGSIGGLGLSALLRRPWRDASILGSHILGALVTAVIFRFVPLIDGATGLQATADWHHAGWRTGAVITACCAVGLVIDLVLQILMTAPPHLVRAAGENLVLRTAPFWTAVLGTSAAITLGFVPLDLWSVPIMASPLVLLRTAVHRRIVVAETRDQGVRALSRMPEISDYVPTGHAQRVRELCDLVGEQLLSSESERKNLLDAALLHDLGQLGLPHPLPGGATLEAAPVDQGAIAAAGASVVAGIGPLTGAARVVAAQSTPFRNVRELGHQVPITARILKVCNAYDELTGGRPERRAAALERLQLGMGYEYDPDVVDLLTHLTERLSGRVGSRWS